MRIALFIRCFKPCSGGLQRHLADLARRLAARGHRVQVVTRAVSAVPGYRETFFYRETAIDSVVDGVETVVLRHSPCLNWLLWLCMKFIGRPQTAAMGVRIFNAIFVRQCMKALRGVDVIHHMGQGSEMLGFAAAETARRLGVPFISEPTIHPGQWGDGFLDMRLYRMGDSLTAATSYEADWLRNNGLTQPIAVTGNGVDSEIPGDGERFRARFAIDGPMVLFLGRKDTDKGCGLLVKAMPGVWAAAPDTVFVMMGPKGSDSGEIPTNTANQDGRVIDIDSATEADKHDALAACTLLCVPSEGESFGLVFMEAGRYGKPVIGRRIPVLEELIGQRRAGLLVGRATGEGNQVEVAPSELSTAILDILCHPALGSELGANCRAASDEFVWPKIVARFEAVFHEAQNAGNR